MKELLKEIDEQIEKAKEKLSFYESGEKTERLINFYNGKIDGLLTIKEFINK